MAIAPELAKYGELAGTGLGLMFLKFGRDDETQADELGLRYMGRENYNPEEMIGVMAMLDGVSESSGGERIPNWLSTHPDPGNRKEHIQGLIERNKDAYSGDVVDRERYLEHIDGIVFGQNPREGFFENNIFYHPDLRFRFDFPMGWETTNMKQGVVGISPNQDAVIQITLTDKQSIKTAANAFFSQQGLSAGNQKRGEINGLPEISGTFTIQSNQGALQGRATFLKYGGTVYQILGYGDQLNWPQYSKAVVQSIRTFKKLTDQKKLSVQPLRIEIVTLERPITFKKFTTTYPSSVSAETVALINRTGMNDKLNAGRKLKRVVGEMID
jgi:predicted Zn-dependent protease